MPVLEANGIQIDYQVQGKGQPLVLISGVGYGRWFWHKLVPLLTSQFQVITFDNRGAGGSSKPPGPYSVPEMAADTAGLLDGLGISGAAVLGHSLGGFIAQELAVSRPELVGRLILASTNHGGMNVIPITPEAMAVLTDRTGDPMELIQRGIDIACAPGILEREPGIVQELVDYRLTGPVPAAQYTAQVMAGAGTSHYSDELVHSRLAALDGPVLILFGEHDRVVPPGNANLMEAKLKNARTVILPGTGHIFPIEDPAAAASAIQEFLTEEN
jgi:pimeloyl-ACP methyl ester carboxylesterase